MENELLFEMQLHIAMAAPHTIRVTRVETTNVAASRKNLRAEDFKSYSEAPAMQIAETDVAYPADHRMNCRFVATLGPKTRTDNCMERHIQTRPKIGGPMTFENYIGLFSHSRQNFPWAYPAGHMMMYIGCNSGTT